MKLPLFVSCAVIFSSALAIAQTPLTANQQMTTGVVGITSGQTARINVLYPTAPAPILQPLCSVTLNIADDQGKILKTLAVSQFVGQKRFFGSQRRYRLDGQPAHRNPWL